MSKRDDINKLYLQSQEFGKYCKIFFWLNCGISIVNIFCNNNVLTVLQITCSLIFVIISLMNDGLWWYDAESERRKNNLQTAFGVRLSEHETDGYYNNQFSPSILKYALNNFENNFFSKNIAEKMLRKSAGKALGAIILLIAVGWMIPDANILLIVTQAIFSAYIVEDAVMLTFYTYRMNKLFDSFYAMLVTDGIYHIQQIPILLSNCIEYESVKAYYKVRLDSEIFEKLNEELSEKWSMIYSKIKIELSEENVKLF